MRSMSTIHCRRHLRHACFDFPAAFPPTGRHLPRHLNRRRHFALQSRNVAFLGSETGSLLASATVFASGLSLFLIRLGSEMRSQATAPHPIEMKGAHHSRRVNFERRKDAESDLLMHLPPCRRHVPLALVHASQTAVRVKLWLMCFSRLHLWSRCPLSSLQTQ